MCKICSKVGHLAKVCSSSRRDRNNFVEPEEHQGVGEAQNFDFVGMFFVNANHCVKPLKIEMIVNKVSLLMELDLGAGISVIPAIVYLEKF